MAQLIVALDIPDSSTLPAILDQLGDAVDFYKVGLELFTAEGPATLTPLIQRKKKIFLDLKLHDIPNTVAKAVSSAGRLGVALMTVHACGGRAMLKAAAEAARALGANRPKLIAVTTLTSLGQSDLAEIGIQRSLADQALALGEMALSSGIDGLVTSVHEAPALRKKFGDVPLLITPGIRPAGGTVGDQKRVATPALAVHAGSSFLVVGRPILDAKDRRAAALSILKEMTEPAQA